MYRTPNSGEFRAFLRRNEMTGAAAAEIVDVEPRTVRRWTSNEGASNRRAIPWSAWALLQLYVGELELDEFRMMVIAEHEARKARGDDSLSS